MQSVRPLLPLLGAVPLMHKKHFSLIHSYNWAKERLTFFRILYYTGFYCVSTLVPIQIKTQFVSSLNTFFTPFFKKLNFIYYITFSSFSLKFHLIPSLPLKHFWRLFADNKIYLFVSRKTKSCVIHVSINIEYVFCGLQSSVVLMQT